jgi:large subunit ribosomal protein L22
MKYGYATSNYDKENMAKVIGRALPMSTKFSIEICNFIRGKKTSEVKKILKQVIDGKKAVPFKIFNKDLSHKKNIGPGRYPKKPAVEILSLVESVEANAQFKGLNTSDLEIVHICAHLASRPYHYGRQRRRKAKRTHLEIIVKEGKKLEEKGKKTEQKKEIKKDVKLEGNKKDNNQKSDKKIEETKSESKNIEKPKKEIVKEKPKEDKK